MAGIRVHCNYPGGNIQVESVSEDRVKLRQDIGDSMEWWFYWNFCIENAQGREMEFEFTNGEVVGVWGPAVSKDGIRWSWAGDGCRLNGQRFRYNFSQDDSRVYFSYSLPYQMRDFETFYRRYQNHPSLQRQILTLSEKGREVPLLTVGRRNADRHIFFTCRHHACESTAAYLLEGMLSHLLEQEAAYLLKHFLIHVVPFVDLDGVEEGDQGKARAPHDHNRDYIEKPIYKSTAAIMEYAGALRPVIAIDFHSPWKWGGRNDHPFFVKQVPPIKEEIEKLGQLLVKATQENKEKDKIPFDPAYDIEMGEEWNQPGHATCSAFFRQRGAKFACTLEFPYFGIGDTAFTQENCRAFGADFAKALERYAAEACK